MVRRRKKKIRIFSIGRLFILFILMGIATTIGVMLFLNFIYKQTVQVPNVKGKDIVNAIKTLNGVGLLNIKVETRPNNKIPEGFVISQDPSENTIIRQERPVKLIVSEGFIQVAVPNVIGTSWRRGEIILRQFGLDVGMKPKVYSDKVKADDIIAQVPPPQTNVQRGDSVNLLVSKGPKPVLIAMPNLVGEKVEEIKSTLEEMGLYIGNITEVNNPDIESGIILSQTPEYGTEVKKRTAISLVVNVEEEQKPTLRYSILRYQLPLSLNEQNVRVFVEDEGGKRRTVYEGTKTPGDILEIMVGIVGEARASIYLNGHLLEGDIRL